MRWELGRVTVVRIVDQAFGLPADRPLPSWCVPEFGDDRRGIDIAFSAFALAVGDRRVVVDPWLADDGPRQRSDAEAHVTRLVDQLAGEGFAAEDVDTVFNSHLDGIGWNTRPGDGGWVPTFPTARYRYSPEQLAARSGDERLVPLAEAGLLDAIDDGDELAPGVMVESAPGHEAGHLALRIRSEGHEALIAGHLFLSPLQVADPEIALDDDPALAAATRRSLLADLADHRGLLLGPLLGRPGGGVVRGDESGYWLEVPRTPSE